MAPQVICNAGPLIVLGKLNRLDLLAALYSEVVLPEAVYDEVVRQGMRRGDADARIVRAFWRRQQWPVLPAPAGVLDTAQFSKRLGRGERAVLALALTSQPVIVLMDDAAARSEARRFGLQVTGTLGVLVQAFRRSYLNLRELEFLFDTIANRPDIWLSAALCRRVLASLRTDQSG
jgi:predicted nucleic acid-binding protein